MEFAFVIADTTGTIQSVNEATERLFGHPANTLIGQTLDALVPAPHRSAHWTGFHALMASDDTELDRGAVIVPVLHADGTTVSHAVHLTQLRDPWGRPVGAMALFALHEPALNEYPPLPSV